MGELTAIRDAYIEEGLAYAQAEARAVQDAMLDLIAKSTLAKNATIKGGVLMQHLSKDMRRATSDFDLDFVRYSISDDSIRRFFAVLNDGSSAFGIALSGPIEELKHQDYSGKRVHALISDANGAAIATKVDIGVHAQEVVDGIPNPEGLSNAGLALRFAASFPNNKVILSGMSTLDQVEDNIHAMRDPLPLAEEQMQGLERVQDVFRSLGMIECTSCHYCTAG